MSRNDVAAYLLARPHAASRSLPVPSRRRDRGLDVQLGARAGPMPPRRSPRHRCAPGSWRAMRTTPERAWRPRGPFGPRPPRPSMRHRALRRASSPAPKASGAITHTMRWDCAESPRAKRTATCRGATGSILRVRPRANGGVASRTHLNGRDEHLGGGQPPLPAPPAPIDAPGGRWRSSQGRARRRRSWRSHRRARR